jgi:hypothetical protein
VLSPSGVYSSSGRVRVRVGSLRQSPKIVETGYFQIDCPLLARLEIIECEKRTARRRVIGVLPFNAKPRP